MLNSTILQEKRLEVYRWPESPSKRLVEDLFDHIREQDLIIKNKGTKIQQLEDEINRSGEKEQND